MKWRGLGSTVVLSTLTLASCSLFTLSPSISFSVQNPYTSTSISIGYTIPSASNIFNSGGGGNSAIMTLEKRIAGTYLMLEQDTTGVGSNGTRQYDLIQLFGSGQGFGSYVPYDGTYRISLQMLSGGKAIPGYYGEQTFTVDTSGGDPSITEVSPGLAYAPTAGTSLPVVISGYHLNTVTTLSVSTNAALASYVRKSPTEIDAVLSFSTLLSPPSFVTFTASNSAGASSTFNLEASSPITLTSPVPTSATAAGNTNQIILVGGAYLTPFTTIAMTDSRGHAIPAFADTLQGQVVTGSAPTYPIATAGGMIPIYANLSGAATGTATITATNPDGLSTSTTFTIN